MVGCKFHAFDSYNLATCRSPAIVLDLKDTDVNNHSQPESYPNKLSFAVDLAWIQMPEAKT